MVNNIYDFIENTPLLNKVLEKIKGYGYKEIKIYRSSLACNINALCFYLHPSEGMESPFSKALDLNLSLEEDIFLGCQVKITVKKQPSEDEDIKLDEESISITSLNEDTKQKLIRLYENVELKPYIEELPVNRKPSFNPSTLPPGNWAKRPVESSWDNSSQRLQKTSIWSSPTSKTESSLSDNEKVQNIKKYLEESKEIMKEIKENPYLLDILKAEFLKENITLDL